MNKSILTFCLLLSNVFSYTIVPNPINSMYTTSTGPILPPTVNIPTIADNPKFNPNWYVVGESIDFKTDTPKKVTLYNSPIAIWKNANNEYAAISDICPHRGASISNGRIDKTTKCIVCPYHTFKYNKYGRLVQIPGQENVRTVTTYNFKTDVPHYPIVEKNGWVYLLNRPLFDISELKYYNNPDTIWVEPESDDERFKCVYLSKMFNIDARTVTENSLDILHISEVHSFGNKKRPLPVSETLDKVADGHHRYIYQYEAGEDSMASKLFGIKQLVVENEYILPHTTIARVRFGDFVNTIVTSAQPVSRDKTQLFVKAYRDNWVFNNPIFDTLFDKITRNMMEKTLCEDKSVIDTIYQKYRDGNFITKYDNLVKLYREDYSGYVDNAQK